MNTRIEYKDDVTIAYVEGKIDSGNADDFKKAIENEPGNRKGLIIDFTELPYISSAGLRVVLSAKKRCKGKIFKVVGVNAEVKNIFDVTGFSEIMEIEGVVRQIEIEGCERIGAGACGECFRLDDETIIKLYYPKVSREEIEREKELAKKAFVMGIPTAISYDVVKSEGRIGVVYELINSKTLSEMICETPEKMDEYIELYADVCRQIHSIHAEKEDDLPSFKEINREDIRNVTGITEEERQYLHKFLDLVPESDTCIHGDLNINNIMVQNGECCLIDMGEFSTGIAMFDLSRILFSMKFANNENEEFNAFYKMPNKTVNEILEKFLKCYFACNSLEEAQEKNPEVKWLYPLAWFRSVTSMMKGERWPEEMRQKAAVLLRENLIPFVKKELDK